MRVLQHEKSRQTFKGHALRGLSRVSSQNYFASSPQVEAVKVSSIFLDQLRFLRAFISLTDPLKHARATCLCTRTSDLRWPMLVKTCVFGVGVYNLAMDPLLDSALARAALEVYERELGSAAAFAETVKPPANADDNGHVVFAEVMVELARQRPQLFGPLLETFGEYPEPAALVAIYTQRTQPQTLGGWRGGTIENEEIAISRQALTHWTGCKLFNALPKIVVVRPQAKLLLAYMRHGIKAAGIVLYEHKALQSTIWLAEDSVKRLRRHGDGGRCGLASLIIHEQLHCVIAQLARGEEGIYEQPVVGAVEEGCVELLTFLACSATARFGIDSSFAAICADSPYAQQRRAIMEVLGGRASAALARRAFAFALANAGGGSDHASADLLNKASARDLTANEWLELLGSVGSVPKPLGLHDHTQDVPSPATRIMKVGGSGYFELQVK
jgi:hypothetical protein